jgi:hypothetical protein
MSINFVGDGIAVRDKGDIISHDGSVGMIKVPVGTSGQILTAQSSATSGLQWATVSVPPSPFDTIIATTTISSGVLTATISSIPTTYRVLEFRIFPNSGTTTGDFLKVRFNSDANANYNWGLFQADWAQGTVSRTDGFIKGGTMFTNIHTTVLRVFQANSTSLYKPFVLTTGYGANNIWECAGLWKSTSAINSITLFGNTTGFAANGAAQVSVIGYS